MKIGKKRKRNFFLILQPLFNYLQRNSINVNHFTEKSLAQNNLVQYTRVYSKINILVFHDIGSVNIYFSQTPTHFVHP